VLRDVVAEVYDGVIESLGKFTSPVHAQLLDTPTNSRPVYQKINKQILPMVDVDANVLPESNSKLCTNLVVDLGQRPDVIVIASLNMFMLRRAKIPTARSESWRRVQLIAIAEWMAAAIVNNSNVQIGEPILLWIAERLDEVVVNHISDIPW
jgi:hypothetical protein